MTTAHHGKAFHGGEHYENFPVGSWLVPKKIRGAILTLYQFARTGDDLADEGQRAPGDRIAGLLSLRDGLAGHAGQSSPELSAVGQALAKALHQHGVPTDWADDLLKAFIRDVHHTPMADEAAVLDYCRYSAAPVGRLVLGLSGLISADGRPHKLLQASDAICTGLQLANFAQDMGQDVGRGRFYFPRNWWPPGWAAEQGVDGLRQEDRAAIATRMADWALSLLDQGVTLPRTIRKSGCQGRRRLAMEIAITIEGGRAIARQVLKDPAAVWSQSPSLSKAQLAMVVLRAFRLI